MIGKRTKREQKGALWVTALVAAAVLVAVLVTALAQSDGTTKIERFETSDPVYTVTVETGAAQEDLGLPESLRAVASLDELGLDANAFLQTQPETQEWEYFGYTAPDNADELYGAGGLVIYETQVQEYRIYGSVGGSENLWFTCDANGNITGVVLDVPVTWNGGYDLDSPGEYVLTASFSGYTYGSAHPSAVITVGAASEDDAPDEEASGVNALSIEGYDETIYVSQDGMGDGSTASTPTMLTNDLLSGLTASTAIVFVSDIKLTEALTIPAGVDVAFVDDDTARKLTLDLTAGLSGYNITIEQGGKLTITTSDETKDSLFSVEGGTNEYDNLHAIVVRGDLVLKSGTLGAFTSNKMFRGLIYVTGSFEMEGGVISDCTFTNQGSGAVIVNGNGEFLMSGGTICNIDAAATTGSAPVLVFSGKYGSVSGFTNGDPSFTMTGGEISDNRGNVGGVYVGEHAPGNNDYADEATFTMTGGIITRNTATHYGGGVGIFGSGNFYMSGGEISDNTAPMGGGVAAYDLYKTLLDSGVDPNVYTLERWINDWHTPGRFEMTGGVITRNTATFSSGSGVDYGCGGGVYVASDTCVIEAGKITDNHADRQGGGIYVGSTPYTLQMYNTVITDNTATILGGGLWFCPTGDATLTVTSGSAVYGNIADSDSDGSSTDDIDAAGDDFVAVPQVGKEHTVNLADRMLGGGEVEWYKDGGVSGSSVYPGTGNALGTADGSARYDSENPGERITGIQDVTDGVAYKAIVSDNAKALAGKLATVWVTGNSSLRGGGIGANGAVVIGTEDDWTLTVKKEWENVNEAYMQPVTIRLVIGGYELDAVELNKENGWTAAFTQLPNPESLVVDGEELSITVIEEGNVYEVAYSDLTTDGDSKTMTITVTNSLLEGLGSIGGRPWADENGNGIQEADETSEELAGMTVILKRWNDGTGAYEVISGDSSTETGKEIQVTIQYTGTDSETVFTSQIDGVYYTVTATATGNGGYKFSGLPPGLYSVEFTHNDIPLGAYNASPKDEGDDDTIDSDADGVYIEEDGMEYNESAESGRWLEHTVIKGIVIESGSEDDPETALDSLNNDSGFVLRRGSITIQKTDGDGNALDGVTFELALLTGGEFGENSEEWTTVDDSHMTAEGGELKFTGLVPGIYRLTEIGTTSNNSLLAEPIYITIPYDGTNNDYDSRDEATEPPSYKDGEDSYWLNLGYDIQNGQIFALPMAGGIGSQWYLIAGGTIVALMGIIILLSVSAGRRRRRLRRLRATLWNW